jgi:uncharacterized damage-inducible protein DinB
MTPGTLAELLRYEEWATQRLLAALRECSNEALDRPFDMGEGSLRKTVYHLWEAEWVWLKRCQGEPVPEFVDESPPIDDIARRFADTRAERQIWLASHTSESLAESFSYERPCWMEPGPRLHLRYDVSLLHVLNHGCHHRAQAVNMLKHVGETPPALDYIIMRVDGHAPDPPLDWPVLRYYLAHADWAIERMHGVAAELPAEALDHEFAIGPGTLRKIMRHLTDALTWWLDNFESGPTGIFPAIAVVDDWQTSLVRYQEVAKRRDALLDVLDPAAITRMVTVVPRPGVERRFPFGVALLQLCTHGTHHRAQALNMLRHSGAKVPSLDVAVFERETVAS